LVTGCGRSGTQYLARILQHLKLRATHEQVYRSDVTLESFSIKTMDGRWKERDSLIEVSWLAAPFVEKQSSNVTVWHQVRDPLKVVRCWASHGYLNAARVKHVAPTPETGPFVHRFLPECELGSDLERAVQYVLRWNGLAEATRWQGNHCRYQVEWLGPTRLVKLLDQAGFLIPLSRAQKAFQEVQPGIGGCVPSQHIDLTWKQVEAVAGGKQLKEMAEEYGYNTHD
jgi:hypothetical protein